MSMDLEDLIYTKAEGIAKIVINRPWVYNAFRTKTIKEMCLALEDAGARSRGSGRCPERGR